MYKKQIFNTLKPGDIFSFLDPHTYKGATIRIYLGNHKWLTPTNTVGKLAQTFFVVNLFAYVLQHEQNAVSIGP